MRLRARISLWVLMATLLMLVGCDKTIHEYPSYPTSPVRVHLEVDRTPAQLHTIIDNTVKGKTVICSAEKWTETNTKTARDYTLDALNSFVSTKSIDGWTIRLALELYYKDRLLLKGKSVKKELEQNPVFDLEYDLPPGDYTLLTWADYVPKGTSEDYHFITENLRQVRTDNDKRLECSNNEQRDCFCCVIPLKVAQSERRLNEQHFSGVLTRAQGRYVILSDDYNDYLQMSDVKIEENISTVFFPSFVNSAYDVMIGCPNDASVGLKYYYTPSVYSYEGKLSALVAEDYSFVSGAESVITANISIGHKGSNYQSNYNDLSIPLYPNKLTVVIGSYLTSKSSSGGVKIDDNFSGEIIIYI